MRFIVPSFQLKYKTIAILFLGIATISASAQDIARLGYGRAGEEDMLLSSENAPDSTETRVVLKRNDHRERILPSSDTKYENGLLFPSNGVFEKHAFYISPDSPGMNDPRAALPQNRQAKTPETAPSGPTGAGNTRYSYDSREWAEYRTNPAATLPETDPFDATRVASLFERASGNPMQDRFRQDFSGTTDYTPLTGRPERQASEIKPSYLKHLKYSKTYGVVLVLANFPLAEIESILSEISILQTDLTRYMGVPPAKEKIELCLFRDEKSYQAFLKDVFPKAPHDRRALYIKLDNQPGTLLVQRSEEFEIDLRHEMTHAIVHASLPYVPIWLDEGLAKYFEVPPGERSEKNPYMKPVRRNTRFGAVPSLKRLERLEHIGQMGSREYRDSWAWVHFLIHYSQDTHRLLAGYLQLLSTLPQTESETGYHDIPSLSSYLDDILERSRDKYREHFREWGLEE